MRTTEEKIFFIFDLETNGLPYNSRMNYKFTNNKNNKHVMKEAIVPGANFIFPILKKVMKSKLNLFIIFYDRRYNF